MQAETWEKLNGTGWGEDLRAINDRPYDGVQIPEFMRSDYVSVSTVVPVSAYRAQGMGRVKHAQHLRDRRVRHVVNGVFWFLVGVLAFAGICNVFMLAADFLGKMV